MMEQMISLRTTIVMAYKRFETPITYIAKFVMGFFIFLSINRFFSSLGAAYCLQLDRFTVLFLAAVVTAILPPLWIFMLMWLFITLHIFYFSLELSIILGLLLLCLIFFYIRIFPKESYFIVLLMLCFFFKMPYFVPLFIGLFSGIGAAGALILGCLIWFNMDIIKQFTETGSTLDGISENILNIPQAFAGTFKLLFELLMDNRDWVFMSIIFIIAAVGVRLISRISFNYSMEIAILLGAVTLIMGMIMGAVSKNVDTDMLGAIVSILISAALVYVCKFFYVVLDYTGTERVMFEDDEYIYYVKAVPKVGEALETE